MIKHYEFTHAWYKRDDKPPSVSEALNWRDHVIESNPEIENVVFIHGMSMYQDIRSLRTLQFMSRSNWLTL
ncbi:hypothetical protein Ct9H90mP29_00890 [bacterium]|nr:MAG: hypothetical protein Ct9H90mP29_00890 [bacterium]